jgi:hypothetical protein
MVASSPCPVPFSGRAERQADRSAIGQHAMWSRMLAAVPACRRSSQRRSALPALTGYGLRVFPITRSQMFWGWRGCAASIDSYSGTPHSMLSVLSEKSSRDDPLLRDSDNGAVLDGVPWQQAPSLRDAACGWHGAELGSTSAISDWTYQIQITTCGHFRGHRGPHDGEETPDEAIPSWSSSYLVPP